MMLSLIFLLVVLVLALTPAWSYSRRWTYRPSGAISAVLVAVLLLVLLGRIRL
jgi:hypothetical protein